MLQVEEETLESKSYIADQDEQSVHYEYTTTREDLLEAMYLQSCYCSLGATLIEDSRKSFDDYMKKTSGFMLVEDTSEKPATIRKLISVVFDIDKILTSLRDFTIRDKDDV